MDVSMGSGTQPILLPSTLITMPSSPDATVYVKPTNTPKSLSVLDTYTPPLDEAGPITSHGKKPTIAYRRFSKQLSNAIRQAWPSTNPETLTSRIGSPYRVHTGSNPLQQAAIHEDGLFVLNHSGSYQITYQWDPESKRGVKSFFLQSLDQHPTLPNGKYLVKVDMVTGELLSSQVQRAGGLYTLLNKPVHELSTDLYYIQQNARSVMEAVSSQFPQEFTSIQMSPLRQHLTQALQKIGETMYPDTIQVAARAI